MKEALPQPRKISRWRSSLNSISSALFRITRLFRKGSKSRYGSREIDVVVAKRVLHGEESPRVVEAFHSPASALSSAKSFALGAFGKDQAFGMESEQGEAIPSYSLILESPNVEMLLLLRSLLRTILE